MIDKRLEESQVSAKAEQMEFLASEARLESLRRLGRRRAGLDFSKLNGRSVREATEAHREKVKAREDEEELAALLRYPINIIELRLICFGTIQYMQLIFSFDWVVPR
jgi:hypothetical protein